MYSISLRAALKVYVPSTPGHGCPLARHQADTHPRMPLLLPGLPSHQWHDASAAILVYDVCNQESLKSTAKWLRRLQDVQPHRRIQPILVGTKIDLADSDRRVVTPQDAAALADALKAQHFEACTVCDGQPARCWPLAHALHLHLPCTTCPPQRDGSGVEAPFQALAFATAKSYEEFTASLADGM